MRTKICLIHPVQSPYWTERLKELAKYKELEIILLLERDTFSHRPGWEPEPIPGVATIILGSSVNASKAKYKDLGYQIDGVRVVPWRLSKILMQLKPDVVLACNATQLLFALPARLILGFHLALIVEDTPHTTRNLQIHKKILKRFIYKRADSWLPFSDDAVSFLKIIGVIKNIYRSSWSIDTDWFRPISSPDCDGDKYTISVVGRLSSLKGVMPMLQEWQSIPKEARKNFQIKIAGSGPLRESIDDFLSANNIEDVKLLGQISYQNVVALLQESSLFVLPTLHDACSLTVPEAMACGCPVITTPYNGARDLIEHGVNGFVADPAKPGELAYWLSYAMKDIERLRIMGDDARKTALQRDNKLVMKQFAAQLLEMSARK